MTRIEEHHGCEYTVCDECDREMEACSCVAVDTDDADLKIDADFTAIIKGATSWPALADVQRERTRQDEKWGQQNHPDGTDRSYEHLADVYRVTCEIADRSGTLTWRHILLEEVYEALAEVDADKLRAELVQVSAVAVSWIESIDRRTA